MTKLSLCEGCRDVAIQIATSDIRPETKVEKMIETFLKTIAEGQEFPLSLEGTLLKFHPLGDDVTCTCCKVNTEKGYVYSVD